MLTGLGYSGSGLGLANHDWYCILFKLLYYLSNLHIANKYICAGHVPGVLLDWLEARRQPAPTTQPTEERHLPEGSLQAG